MWQFLGIGAQKAGTTWLYQNLRRHPEIAFPGGKEMHFWDREHGSEDIEHYLTTFGAPGISEGEITPAYAILPSRVVAEIADVGPSLRLIYLLRNPVERAWSSALMALERAEMRWGEASDAWFIDHFQSQGSMARGDYAACLQCWLEHFPREQILVLFHDELQQSPRSVLERACTHIGVAKPSDEMAQYCQQRVFSGAGHPLPAHLRGFLEALYEPRIQALEALLGIGIPAWRTSNGRAGC